jgi:hypothetical protein
MLAQCPNEDLVSRATDFIMNIKNDSDDKFGSVAEKNLKDKKLVRFIRSRIRRFI